METPQQQTYRKIEKANLMQLRHPGDNFKHLSMRDLEEESSSSGCDQNDVFASIPLVAQKPVRQQLNRMQKIFEQKIYEDLLSDHQYETEPAFNPRLVGNAEADLKVGKQQTILTSSQLTVASQHRKEEADLTASWLFTSINANVAEDPSGVNLAQMREFMVDPGASKQIAYLTAKQQEIKQSEYQISVEADGLLKLRLLHKDMMYIPREVLQDKMQFAHISVLDVSNCSIVELEGKIFIELRYLKKLNASRNQIRQLSVRIGQLEFLEVLNLDNNCLEMIPMEIGNLYRTLKVLKLACNKLKSITNRIRELSKLTILHVQSNMIRTLPDNMELTNLQECLLMNNELEQFNLPIDKMQALTRLGLDWFAYILPPAQKIIERQADSAATALDEVQNSKPASTPYGITRLQNHLGRNCALEDSTEAHQQQKSSNQNAAGNIPQASRMPMTRVKTQSVAIYQRNQSTQPTKVPSIDYFKELSTLMSYAREHSLSTNLANCRRMLTDQMTKDSTQSQLTDNQVTPRRRPKNVTRAISFVGFAKHFLKQMMEVKDDWINSVDERGRTMLHYAAMKGDMIVVKELLANGADKNLVDKYDFNPYGYAMREDHYKVAMQILLHKRFTYLDSIKGAGTFGSLLHLAVAKLQPEHVDVMLSHGVNPNIFDLIQKDTPCHLLVSCFNRNPHIARLIMQLLSDAGGDLNAKNKEGCTPLHWAIKKTSFQAIKALIEIGLHVSDKKMKVDLSAFCGMERQTPMHLAAQSNSHEILQLLLDEKPDLFLENSKNERPFNAVDNNLLMLKLIKKEEKRFHQQLYEQTQAKESMMTDEDFVKEALSRHSDNNNTLPKYSTFTATLNAIQKQLQYSGCDETFQVIEPDKPYANNTLISIEDDFADIRSRRDRSESCGLGDVDEAKDHGHQKIVQLAGFTSTKKGVGIYKNGRRETFFPNEFDIDVRAVESRRKVEDNIPVSNPFISQLEHQVQTTLEVEFNAEIIHKPIFIDTISVLSPSSMLRTSIKFNQSPEEDKVASKVKQKKRNFRVVGLICYDDQNRATAPAGDKISSFSCNATTSEPQILNPGQKRQANPSQPTRLSHAEPTNQARQLTANHLKMKNYSCVQSAANPNALSKVDSFVKVGEDVEIKRSAIGKYLTDSIEEDKTPKTQQNEQILLLPQNIAKAQDSTQAQRKETQKSLQSQQMRVSKTFMQTENLNRKQANFVHAKNSIDCDLAENIQFNKTTRQDQLTTDNKRSMQQPKTTIDMTLSEATIGQLPLGRKSAAPQFHNASKNLFEKPALIGLKLKQFPFGKSEQISPRKPDELKETRANPRVTTVTIAKKNQRKPSEQGKIKRPESAMAARAEPPKPAHQTLFKSVSIQKPQNGLLIQKTLGCDVDSEADEAKVDSRKIWSKNTTAHGKFLQHESTPKGSKEDFQIIKVPSHMQTPMQQQRAISRNSIPMSAKPEYSSTNAINAVKPFITMAEIHKSNQAMDFHMSNNSQEVIQEYALLSHKQPVRPLQSDQSVYMEEALFDKVNSVVFVPNRPNRSSLRSSLEQKHPLLLSPPQHQSFAHKKQLSIQSSEGTPRCDLQYFAYKQKPSYSKGFQSSFKNSKLDSFLQD